MLPSIINTESYYTPAPGNGQTLYSHALRLFGHFYPWQGHSLSYQNFDIKAQKTTTMPGTLVVLELMVILHL